jgi:hypothetical protein
MSRKWGRKPPPAGWDYIEPIMDALDRELREAVDAPHESKRKIEVQWPIHQINWQRTRYIYDMYYKVVSLVRACLPAWACSDGCDLGEAWGQLIFLAGGGVHADVGVRRSCCVGCCACMLLRLCVWCRFVRLLSCDVRPVSFCLAHLSFRPAVLLAPYPCP